MSIIDDRLENDWYTKIINFFKNQPKDKDSIELWKNKSFIKLMKVLERTKNKELVQNAIIIIISLFENLPPDLYNNQGSDSNSLNPEEKKSFKTILKSEFIDAYPT